MERRHRGAQKVGTKPWPRFLHVQVSLLRHLCLHSPEGQTRPRQAPDIQLSAKPKPGGAALLCPSVLPQPPAFLRAEEL